jgi:signal transduction histidine kinase
VRGNFQKLEQVTINLIQNACQALTDQRQAIRVSTHHDAASNCIVITVWDEGAGIAPENLSQVQDPFFTTRHESGGTGLGLSISSRIVEEHGGTMNFESEVGMGTRVRVSLPVMPAPSRATGALE